MSDPRGEYFAASDEEISFVPTTLDADERTVDVVWYGGATVLHSVIGSYGQNARLIGWTRSKRIRRQSSIKTASGKYWLLRLWLPKA